MDLLEKQVRENFNPLVIAVCRRGCSKRADRTVKRYEYPQSCQEWTVCIEIATLPETEILVTAIVGMIGIRPTIEAIKAGKDIALANKETLVTAGHIIMPLAERDGCSDPSGGQRAQRHFPVPFTGKTQEQIEEDSYHSLRRPLPRKETGRT